MNLARQHPDIYARYLEELRARFRGNFLVLPGRHPASHARRRRRDRRSDPISAKRPPACAVAYFARHLSRRSRTCGRSGRTAPSDIGGSDRQQPWRADESPWRVERALGREHLLRQSDRPGHGHRPDHRRRPARPETSKEYLQPGFQFRRGGVRVPMRVSAPSAASTSPADTPKRGLPVRFSHETEARPCRIDPMGPERSIS